MYYEIHGSGRPLVPTGVAAWQSLDHRTSFGKVLPELFLDAADYRGRASRDMGTPPTLIARLV